MVALRPRKEAIDCIQTLCSLAAPIHPSKIIDTRDPLFSWLNEQESYLDWVKRDGPALLHIFGTRDTLPTSEHIIQHLKAYQGNEAKTRTILQFTFQRHDNWRNSIKAMVNTLLAQLLNHRQHLPEWKSGHYKRMALYRSWTEVELFCLLRLSFQGPRQQGITCMISHLDDCDDSRIAFLSHLTGWANDTEWPL